MSRDTSAFPRPHSAGADADKVDIGAILRSLWRGRWIILAMMIAGMLVLYLLVSQITPRYTSRASVMLNSRAVQMMGPNSVVSDLTLNDPLLDTEAGVLRSNLLLEQVINGIDPAQLAPLDPANDPPGLVARLTGSVTAAIGQLQQMAGLEADAPAAPAALSEEERRMRRLVGALRSSMIVMREGRSYLISVSIETTHAQLSALLANRIVEVYLERQAEQLNASVRDASRFLADRVSELRQQVSVAETAVEDYRISQLADGAGTIETLSQQMMDLSTQIAVAQADLVSVEARYRQIQTVIDNEGFASAAELLSSPFVLSLREQRSVLLREEADLASRYAVDHPDRVRRRASVALIDEELTREVGKILDSLNNDVLVARIKVESLRASLASLEERSADISLASLELRQLEREASAARASYEVMLTRLNETRSVEELNRPDASVVERAVVSGAPSAPRTMLFTAFGGVLGFSAGLIAVYLRALSRRGFSSPGQVERVTGVPVVGTVARAKWRNLATMIAALRDGPYAAYPERLRQIRAMLRSGGRRARVIMVTSSVQSEGKSSTALGMAYLEALAGRSCLLLDFDTRRPNLGQALSYDHRNGRLADYLSGRHTLAESVDRASDVKFDVLSSAKPVPHLADIVSATRLQDVVVEMANAYDTVIIDTPPILIVSDSAGLVPHVDCVLLLIRHQRTREEAVQETVRRLSDMGAPSMQIVITMTDPGQERETFGVANDYSYQSS